jgi:dienelactone hydrolase
MKISTLPWIASVFSAAILSTCGAEPAPDHRAGGSPLPGTQALLLEGDIASNLVAGVDRFLLRELDRSVARRAKFWHRDFSSAEAYNKSIETNRQRLAHILGVRDKRVPFAAPELLATTAQSALVGRSEGFEIFTVRWPAFGNVYGEGLLLSPVGRAPIADVVAIPDAEQTPEQLAGLADGIAPESQYARRLAESGCRVIVPMIINRDMGPHKGRANLTAREFLYRPAYELGRHLIGYEVQKVLAAVDWFARERGSGTHPIGVIGWGEGGLLALDAAALDSRLDAVCASGSFDDRLHLWEEPIDRNVFGLLEQFGDAELAAMVAPRAVIIEAARGPEITVTGKGGGAPARLLTPKLADVRNEFQRARQLVRGFGSSAGLELVVSGDGTGPFATDEALRKFLSALGASLRGSAKAPERLLNDSNPQARQIRQMDEIDGHNQWLLTESPYWRQDFMKKLDTGSLDKYERSAVWYRDFFYNEVIGRFDEKPLSPNVRSRKSYDEAKWTGYEVVMDVFPDVIAYGILLLPKDLKPGERRPVVVCQHGLEGRPRDVIKGDSGAYHDFAAKLAERGFITFAPQNLYLFTDRFRTLQRKSNPLKKTLYSIIVPQHQQMVDWLETLPFVDPHRVAFYGLSYGGETAMRVPAVLKGYCLSICSGDFNQWATKIASTDERFSFMYTIEWEMPYFNMGNTFDYAEMAYLIFPRPFMVERGHNDRVGRDRWVAYEYAKARYLYAQFGMSDRTEIEYFNGGHAIRGEGAFEFLHKHLKWNPPGRRSGGE